MLVPSLSALNRKPRQSNVLSLHNLARREAWGPTEIPQEEATFWRYPEARGASTRDGGAQTFDEGNFSGLTSPRGNDLGRTERRVSM